MLLYDHRMVEGRPLQYYNPYSYTASLPVTHLSFLNRFEVDQKSRNMSEDFVIPHSPNSPQSDSDNSVSSIDVSTEPIQRTTTSINSPPSKNTESQCCWRSCGIVFESLDQLSDHVSKVHASSGLGGLYYCGWEGCARNNKGFNARYKMLVHVRTHTNEKPHQCTQCHKCFSRAENLKIHSRSHSGEKPYVCPVPGCNKAYSNSSDRFKHTRTHQVDKPYQCKVAGCPKRYTDPSSLRKHVKTYKHFVNENNQNNRVDNENVVKDTNAEKRENGATKLQIAERGYSTVHLGKPIEDHYRQNVEQSCDCNHTCYLTKCLNLGALINLKGNTIDPWNNIIEPFLSEPKRIYMSPYDISNDHMDVDVPLDLSIGRKHI